MGHHIIINFCDSLVSKKKGPSTHARLRGADSVCCELTDVRNMRRCLLSPRSPTKRGEEREENPRKGTSLSWLPHSTLFFLIRSTTPYLFGCVMGPSPVSSLHRTREEESDEFSSYSLSSLRHISRTKFTLFFSLTNLPLFGRRSRKKEGATTTHETEPRGLDQFPLLHFLEPNNFFPNICWSSLSSPFSEEKERLAGVCFFLRDFFPIDVFHRCLSSSRIHFSIIDTRP